MAIDVGSIRSETARRAIRTQQRKACSLPHTAWDGRPPIAVSVPVVDINDAVGPPVGEDRVEDRRNLRHTVVSTEVIGLQEELVVSTNAINGAQQLRTL